MCPDPSVGLAKRRRRVRAVPLLAAPGAPAGPVVARVFRRGQAAGGHVDGQVVPLRLGALVLVRFPSACSRRGPGRNTRGWGRRWRASHGREVYDRGGGTGNLGGAIIAVGHRSLAPFRRRVELEAGDVALHEPGRAGPELDVVPLDGAGRAPGEAPSVVPPQPFLVLGPDVRGDGPDGGVAHGSGDDVVHGGVDQAEAAVGGEEAQGADVERGGAGRGGGLDAADDAADDLGAFVVPCFLGPGYDAREAAGDGVGGEVVEGVRVADGEEEGVYAPQGGGVVLGYEADVGPAGEGRGERREGDGAGLQGPG